MILSTWNWARLLKRWRKKAQLCPGAIEELNGLRELQKYKLAVVSSSALSRVRASIKKVGMEKYFNPNWVYSAATSLRQPTSKPDPAVYLYAMKQLGVKPEECLTIEDSRSGATAAKRANIPLVGYVGPYDEEERKKIIKVHRDECGAKATMYHWSEFPDCLKVVIDYF